MTRTASARTTTRRTLRPIAVGLVVVTAAIIGTLVYQSASSSATSPPLPGTAQPSPVTPRNGPLGTIAWPASGVSAAGISGIGVLPGPGASQPVPIASVAKMMTAYIILRDHPLGAGEPGPAIVVQPGEAAAYPAQARNGDSLVRVSAGEQLTERQALEALLLPSADNVAWILARWDGGSQAAFTAQMNATARRLGMTDTHYTDPSGLSASTTSTAADQVRLGMAAMSEPALAQIVALRSAVIPVAGVVRNTNTLLGQDGITGLKTGSDTAAGGCILLAAWQQARGHDTLIVAATFGQPGTMATMLPNALQAGHQLVLALGRALAGQSAQHISGKKAGNHPADQSTIAVAVERDLPLATDDRKARRLCEQRKIPEPTRTLALIHGYAQSARLDDRVIHALLIKIRDRANFLPPRTDPDYKWWTNHIGSL